MSRQLVIFVFAILFPILPNSSANAAVGRTDGQGDVSASGEATYTIPITVPPGVNGLTPDLALAYGHRNSDGMAGVGWGLNGLSEIARCARTVAQDGSTGSVSLMIGDRFCVDGNKLRVTSGSSTYGYAGSQYRSEIDDITRYTAYGTAGNGPQYFKAEAKSGLIYFYGNTSDSQIESLASGYTTTVLVWALAKIVDRNGNEIKFKYQEDGAPNGEYRIDYIEYGGNPGQGISPRYKIDFMYGTLPTSDVKDGFAAGGKLEETNRLNNVRVWYTEPATDELTRSYALTYESSTSSTGRSRLASVTECAGNTSNCLLPTTFTYQDGTNNLLAEQSSNSTTGNLVLSLDINGDGLTDLAYPSGGTWRYQLATGTGYQAAVNSGASAASSTEAIIIDYDSDGLEDILMPQSGYWHVIYGTSSGLSSTLVNTGANDYSGPGNATAMDLNGDGRDDLVWGENVGTYVNSKIRARYRESAGFSSTIYTLFTGTSSSNLEGPTLFSSVYKQDRHNFFDVNGDGKADIAFVTVQFSGPPWEPIERYYTDIVLGGMLGTFSVETNTTQGLPIDINGDGYTDIAYLRSGGLKYRISNGKTFGSVTSGPSITGLSFARAVAMDWNGDGMQDLLIPENETAGSGEVWKVLISTGDSFNAASTTSVSSNNVVVPRRIDKNGDGMDDLGFVVGSQYRSRNHAGVYPDLLKTATDALGNSITFNYGAITEGSYAKSTGASFPNQDYIGPMQVVTSAVPTTGLDNSTYTLTYSYSGALMNLQGRGLGGFETRTVTDSRNSITTVETFEREFPYRGRPASIVVKQPGGDAISESLYTWASKSAGTGYDTYKYPFASAVTVKEYGVGGGYDGVLLSEKTTTINANDMDAYGTPSTITTVTTEPTGANGLQWGTSYTEIIAHSSILNSTSNWCLGKPMQTQWTNEFNNYGGAQLTRTLSRSWDTGYTCRLNSDITEPTSGTYKVTRSYAYDSFGNVSSDTTTGINMAARTTTINWGSNGHYPVSITNAEGETTLHAWDYALGVRTAVTDANGESVSMLYDDFGRMTRETRPDNTYTDYSLSTCGTSGSYCGTSHSRVKVRLQVTDKATDGSTIRTDTYHLDKLERQIQVEQQVIGGGLSRTRTIYDDLGRVSQQSAPDFALNPSYYTTTEYDLVGRPTSITRPIDDGTSSTQSTVVSYQGLETVTTDAEGKTSIKWSDVMGRVIRSQDQAVYFQNFQFDAFGSLKKVTDGPGNTLFEASYAYGLGPMRTQTIDMDMGAWTYSPNALGEVVSYTDANGKSFTATFDKLSRPKTRVDSSNASTSANTTSWIWGTSAASNNIGKLVSISSTGHSESYTYDAYGRLSKKTTVADTTYYNDYTYSSTTGLLDTHTFPTSTSGVRVPVKYEYDHGVVNKISHVQSSIVYWQANAVNARGQVVDENLENGVQSIRGYDAVTGLVDFIDTGNGVHQDLTLSWNKVGSLSKRHDLAGSRNLTEEFFYDNLHRLDYSKLNGVQNLNISYDALGNILSKSDVGGGNWLYDTTKRHAVTNASGNTFTYDANGNQVTRNGNTVTWYSYNYPYQIHHGGGKSHTYYYDGNRQRWKEVYNNGSTTETRIYVGNDFEKRTSGGVTYYRHYIRAEGRLVAIKVRGTDGTNTQKTVLTDHLGSVVEILNASGALDVSENFAAFGQRRDPTDWTGGITNESTIAGITQIGYTGHRHLDGSALVHLGGRVLDTLTGRFLSADPNIPDAMNTQSFNRYSYVENNPLSATDPSGFWTKWFSNDRVRVSGRISYSWNRKSVWVPIQPKGCFVAGASGCYGKPGSRKIVDAIFDAVRPPLPSYGLNDSLILYYQQPDWADDYESEIILIEDIARGVWYEFVIMPVEAAAEGKVLKAACMLVKVCRAAQRFGGRAVGYAVDYGKKWLKRGKVPNGVRPGPAANNGIARPHGGARHNDAIDQRVDALKGDPAVTDIRKNQVQVDVNGNRVGNNRPDVQYNRCGVHHCVEYDTVPANGARHGDVIRQNDPNAAVELNDL